MGNIIQSKVLLSILFLVLGVGIGNQLPIIKVLVQPQIEEIKTVDKDGVPILSDYRNPIVDGKRMGLMAFLTTYCDGLKETNRTCHKVVDYSNRTEG